MRQEKLKLKSRKLNLSFAMESFIELLLAALINLRQLRWDFSGEVLSSLFAFSTFGYILLLPLLLFGFLKKRFEDSKVLLEGGEEERNKEEKELEEEKRKLGDQMYADLRAENKLAFFYNFFFLLRRLLHCLLLTVSFDFAFLQCQGILALIFVNELYLLIVQPFKDPLMNFLEVLNEFCIYLCALFCLVFAGLVEDPHVFQDLGWAYIGVLGIQFAMNICFVIGISLREFERKKKSKKPRK